MIPSVFFTSRTTYKPNSFLSLLFEGIVNFSNPPSSLKTCGMAASMLTAKSCLLFASKAAFLLLSFLLTSNHKSRFGLIRAGPSEHPCKGVSVLPFPLPVNPGLNSGEQFSTYISCSLVGKICQMMEGKQNPGDSGKKPTSEGDALSPAKAKLGSEPTAAPQPGPPGSSSTVDGKNNIHLTTGLSFFTQPGGKIHACKQQLGRARWEGLSCTIHIKDTLQAGKGQRSWSGQSQGENLSTCVLPQSPA